MKTLTVILGDMLFNDLSPLSLSNESHIFMCEDYNLCTHYKYHKHKLIFFLSSMRSYRDYLKKTTINITYHELNKNTKKNDLFFDNLKKCIKANNIDTIQTYEIHDKFFRKQIKVFCKSESIELITHKSQSFYYTAEYFEKLFEQRKTYQMNDFYKKARKETNILMDGDEPVGGKWHFDYENRKKIPKNYPLPKQRIAEKTQHTHNVITLVNSLFTDHPGNTDNFSHPTTHEEAKRWFNIFLEERFTDFGAYEDAIRKDEHLLFHSHISSLLNIGLLTPKYVINRALETHAPIQSIEGFVRQILGWREFMKGMYELLDFSDNTLSHKRRLTQSWYNGTTGIDPLDDTIKKVNKHAYAHHIERLMIVGNCMLLCEIHPDDVYKWFMELFIDSADWVMMPNVYAMSQFAIGTKMTSKPYISGSNYILKMSDYSKDDWSEIMDGLYWRFIKNHTDVLKSNHRMGFMIKTLEKMKSEKKEHIFSRAEMFLKEHTK